MTEIGGLATDGLIERLNTPYPPASEADEDPHRRTGLLSAGVHYIVQDDTDRITVYVISSRDGDDPAIPWYLESGTATMAARNYMLRTQQEWEDRLAPEFENLFWGYYQ